MTARLAVLSPTVKTILRLCLFVLSAVLVLWPIVPSPFDPLPMQSVSAIQHLPWFAVLFNAWAVCFAALLLGISGTARDRLGLCVIFTVVFVGVWGFASPWGNHGDSIWQTAEVMHLLGAGKLPPGGHPNFPYLDFPGLHLLALTLVETTGMDVFMAIRVYLLASGVMLTLVLYAMFLRLIGTPNKAACAVVLAFVSSVVLASVANQFHPINLSTIYIVTFILLLGRLHPKSVLQSHTLVLLLLLMAAAAAEYVFTPVFFAMVFLSYYILSRPANAQAPVTLAHAVIPLALLFVWEMYVTVWNFPTTVRELPVALQAILDGSWVLPILHLLRQNAGPAYPWWGNIVRGFWWSSVFGVGTLLMLWRVKMLREVRRGPELGLVLFLGTIGAMMVGSLVGGVIGIIHGALTRYLWIAPLFLVPALMQSLGRPRMKAAAVTFGVAGLLLMFPTFIADGGHVSTYRAYRHELAAGEFIRETYGSGEGLTIFCTTRIPVFYLLYSPEAHVRPSIDAYGATVDVQIWQSIEEVVHAFRASPRQGNLLIDWPKMRGDYQELVGIPIDHPNWRRTENELSSTNRIYDNRSIQLYVPAESGPSAVPSE